MTGERKRTPSGGREDGGVGEAGGLRVVQKKRTRHSRQQKVTSFGGCTRGYCQVRRQLDLARKCGREKAAEIRKFSKKLVAGSKFMCVWAFACDTSYWEGLVGGLGMGGRGGEGGGEGGLGGSAPLSLYRILRISTS